MKQLFKKKLSIVAILLILIFIGSSSARYIYNNSHDHVKISADKFYFTVDLLGDTNDDASLNAEYTLYGGVDQDLVFKVNNFFDSSRVTQADITYDIKVESDSTGFEYGFSVNNDSTVYQNLSARELVCDGTSLISDVYNFKIKEGYKNGDKVVVTINSTKPYKKTMTLTFVLSTDELPVSYTLTDKTNYTELIVRSNVELNEGHLVIDFNNYNVSDNVLMVDTTNIYTLNSDQKLDISFDDNQLWLNSFVVTNKIESGMSFKVYFFKKYPSQKIESLLKPAIENNGVYYIYLGGEQGGVNNE